MSNFKFFILWLISVSAFCQVYSSKQFAKPDRVRYDGSCMTIEGKDMFILSAAFHYFRCPQELWHDRFEKIKEAGFNTVETYVPWNWHERNMPRDINDFSQCDFSDLKAWLKMAHEEFGLYTIVRPGPFICAEWAGGAYPRWLAKHCPEKYSASFWLRSDDPEHVKWSQHWYNAVCKVFAKEQITRKPKGQKGIIMVQLENEYVYFDMSSQGKISFLKSLYQTATENHIDVPMFTCVTPETRHSDDKIIHQLFDMDNQYVWWNIKEAKSRIEYLKTVQPDAPAFVCELQGGWFSTVGGNLSEDSYLDGRHARGMALMAMAGGSTGLNYYMFFGGTHFAGWGARRMTTSYDYGAALKENGGVGEKFLAIKGVGDFIKTYNQQIVRSKPVDFSLLEQDNMLEIGVREAPDGTRFVFVLNNNRKADYQKKVSIMIKNKLGVSFDCELKPSDSKVLVIPPHKSASEGEWYPSDQEEIKRPTQLPLLVRIHTVYRRNENFKLSWQALPDNVSLPELGVNDCRYSAYKSRVELASDELAKYGTLLFDMYTADPLYVQVNGLLAKRASSDEFDNTFMIDGLLKTGENEIIAIYENQGHAHGYRPMEELSGIRRGGLGFVQVGITPIEEWEVQPIEDSKEATIQSVLSKTNGWTRIMLDAETFAGLATIQIAGLAAPKWPAAWVLQGKNGTAVYRTNIQFTEEMIKQQKTVLEFGSVDDGGRLYVNGKFVAEHHQWDKPFIANIESLLKIGNNEISIVVSNSSGAGGILKPVRLLSQLKIEKPLLWNVAKDMSGTAQGWIHSKSLSGWEPVHLDTISPIARKGNNIQPKGKNDALMTWYKFTFDLPEKQNGVWFPWRLLVSASGNGYIWINGHNIGRHWEVGPQREFYLPECWLKFGKGKTNTVVFGLRQTPSNGAIIKAIEIAPYNADAEFRK